MRLRGLMEPLISSEEFIELESYIKGDKHPIEIEGLSESGKSYVINGIYEVTDKPVVVITNSDMEAKNLYEDLNLYLSNVYYFPAKEIVFYNVDAISGDLRWARLNVIKEILSNSKNIIVTSIDAFAARYTPKNLFKSHTVSIRVGDEVDFKELSKILVEAGYDRVDVVEGKGEFSLRGGLLDLFPTNSIYPYRIELFGDEIDSIRTFNTESQRSIEKVNSIEVFPAKEIIVDDEVIEYALKNIKEELELTLKNNKDKERGIKLNTVISKNLEELREMHDFETIDSYLPLFYKKSESLFDYLEDYIFVLDDKVRSLGKLDSTYLEFNENYSIFLQRGDILPSQGKLLLEKEEIIELLEEKINITMDAINKGGEFLSPIRKIEINSAILHHYQGQLDLLIEDILKKKKDGYRTVILSGTRVRGERLVSTLRERGIESSYRDNIESIALGEVVITFGNLLKGFECPKYKTCVISDKEVFGEAKRKLSKTKSKSKGVSKIKSFAELKPGDYVVHVNHGIGVYKGIKQIEVSGHKRDYLDIVYDKGDKLYVPVDQLDLVQKYIGSEGKSPKVNKLGGAEWQKAKSKVKKIYQ